MTLFLVNLISFLLPYFTVGLKFNDIKILNTFGDKDPLESQEDATLENGWENPIEDVKISDIFGDTHPMDHCEENAVVASWCDERVNLQLECNLQKDLDIYGCNCYDNHAACPTECIGGEKPRGITRSGIYCSGIPEDTPNYILKEGATVHDNEVHCEGNAVISSWCDEFMDSNLKCSIRSSNNDYVCNCDGNAASCPIDCIGGSAPYKRDKHTIFCSGIPMDQPNYVIKPRDLSLNPFLFIHLNTTELN